MQDQRQGCEAGAGDLVGITCQRELVRAVFFDGNKPRCVLRDSRNVVILSLLSSNREAKGVKGLMEQVYYRGEALDVTDSGAIIISDVVALPFEAELELRALRSRIRPRT